MKFRPPRNRDAAFIIRGYVYQVEVTMLRWVKLGENQILQLECGEDIDTVSRHLNGDEHRLLEQVGHRSGSLTLRSGKAVEAVANAVESLRHNPDQDLEFLFTTNASIGKERPSRLRQPRNKRRLGYRGPDHRLRAPGSCVQAARPDLRKP